MRTLAAAVLLLAPAIAVADDDAPAAPVDTVEVTPTVEAPIVVDAAATVEVAAPGTVTPVVVAPVATPHCNWRQHDPWYSEMWFHHRPELAVGLGEAGVKGDGGNGTQKSLLIRVVANYGIEAEVELAKVDLGGNHLETDGLTLMKTFGHHLIRPYVLGELGNGKQNDLDKVKFGEVGLGLMLRTRHFSIGADMRWGVLMPESQDVLETSGRTTDPTPQPVPEPIPLAGEQHYTRGRLVALLYF